jgi:radical SAM superfamily enzyme YgiQ (UPF0313 family)
MGGAADMRRRIVIWSSLLLTYYTWACYSVFRVDIEELTMKKRVVFVVPQSIWTSKDHLPSLGLACIAAILENDGYDIYILDCELEGYSVTGAADTIAEFKPDAIGLTASSHNRFEAIKLARAIKQRRSVLLFAGGVHFGLTGMDALRNVPELDVIVKGEGEKTTQELLKAYFGGQDLAKIRGIIYKDFNRQIIENPNRALIKDLNVLPDPAWNLFDLDKYDAKLQGYEGGRAIGVMSSRGCPFGCSFCANEAFWGRRFRRFEAERFVKQVEQLYRQYGFRHFDFWDDTFTIPESYAHEVCELVLKKELDIRFYLRTRVDSVNRTMLKIIRKAGGVAIGYGIESGSQTVLDSIPKRITVSQARRSTKMSVDLGFIVKVFLMTSLPGETLRDVEMTIKLAEELKEYGGDRIHVSYGIPTTIYPGTRVEAIAKKRGLLPANFSWNSDYEFETAKNFGRNPVLPCFENPYLSLGEIIKLQNSRSQR